MINSNEVTYETLPHRNIKLKPLLVLAADYDDAANILAHALILGMANRPDADFDVVDWSPAQTDFDEVLTEWLDSEHRGIAWVMDEGAGIELVSTGLERP